MSRRKQPEQRVCRDCREPVEERGREEYEITNPVTGATLINERRILGHVDHELDTHEITATTFAVMRRSTCVCCGTKGKGLCDPCREAHGYVRGGMYVASLRCPVREELEALEADVAELMTPGTTFGSHFGHSEECWRTTPMNITDEIRARCPGDHTPVVREKRAMTPARELAESLDYSRAPRAPRE